MDEPTAGVDLASQGVLSQVLARLAARGATMLIVTHELRALQGVLSRIIELDGGRISFDGTFAEHDSWHDRDHNHDRDGHRHDHNHDGHHHDEGAAQASAAAGPLDRIPGGHDA